jgi:hypothetical protein
MFVGSRTRPVRDTENLTAASRLPRQCGILLLLAQPYMPPRPVTGIALLLTFLQPLVICMYPYLHKDKTVCYVTQKPNDNFGKCYFCSISGLHHASKGTATCYIYVSLWLLNEVSA